MEVTYERCLHKAQRVVFEDAHRFRVSCSGRRFGKSRLVLDELIRASLGFQGEMSKTSPQMVIGALPTAVQARPILWKPLVNLFTTTELKHVVKDINLSNMTIQIEGKPSIKVVGANDKGGDRLRGNRIYFIALDEVQDINPVVWTEVVRPALSDTVGSRAIFTGTPKGKVNFLYDLSQMETGYKNEWKFFNYGTEANPTIPKDEIEAARISLPPRVFQQEYEANFVAFPGQIWSELDSINRVASTEVPNCDLVVMGVDFGDRHPAAIVLGRESRSMTWYILDAWSPNTGGGESQPVPRATFDNTIERMVLKYNATAVYCDPSRPSDILAIRELGDHPGFNNAVAGFNPIQSGISQVSKLLWQKKLLVVERNVTEEKRSLGFLSGQQVFDNMLSYHWVIDKRGDVTEEPADGSFSHICDSLRYGLAYKGG